MMAGELARSRIAVLLPAVWGVRNVVHGGIASDLAMAGVELHLILPGGSPPAGGGAASQLEGPECHAMLPAPTAPVRGKALMDDVLRSAFARRHAIRSYPIYRRWRERDAGAVERVRSRLVELLAAPVAGSAAGLVALQRWIERRYRTGRDLVPFRRQLAAIGPDLVWSTACFLPREYPYYLAARDLGIPVVTSIASFDNLTSRSLYPEYDHYMVWSEAMRDQLLALYPAVDAARVTVTGTPQFDFHRRAEYRWTRERTLATLGLPPRSRYLLHAASHASLAPDEPALVRGIAARVGRDPLLAGHAVVVRIHPLESPARWQGVLDDCSNVVLSRGWDATPDADGWALTTPADQARLVSTILHCDACINVASTTTLDAAILDRPVIGIDFAGAPDAPREILYEEYEAEHYRPLVRRGGLRLARGWDELLDALRDAVRDPRRDAARRADMVRHECGLVDGRAAERVTATMLLLAGRDRRSGRMSA